MKCERCGSEPSSRSFELHDYCLSCSKNLCETCMKAGYCRDGRNRKHEPANHGAEDEYVAGE